MLKRGKKKWIIAIILLVALIGGYTIITLTAGVDAEVVIVDKGPVCRLIKEIGTVESENSIIISSNFTGEIKGLVALLGDLVKNGDTLLTGDKDIALLDLKSLKAQLSGLEISHSRAKEIAGRNKELYEQGALSREEYDAALATERALAAEVSSLRYSIESYAKTSSTTGIVSPINGTITDVFVKEGEYVGVGAPLFEIADLERLYIKVNLISEDADMVDVGDQTLIYLEKGGDTTATGRVRRIHFKAKEEVSGLGIIQKRVTVEIEMNPDIAPRLGSDIDLAIVAEEKEAVVRVSAESIFSLDGLSYIYVVDNGRARLRQVEKGLEGDNYTEIISGLIGGETVIHSPGNDIVDGVSLRLAL